MRKIDVISNEYDGPQKPKQKLLALSSASTELDYINSDDAMAIDTGIRETISGIRLSILAMGIGLAKIKAKSMYIDLGYRSMAAYIERLADESDMNRSSVFSWLYIGEAFLTYRDDLDRVGFTDEDGPTKLPYVSRALEHYPNREVFKNVKEMSRSAFIDWAKGPKPDAVQVVRQPRITVKDNQVFIGSQLAVTLADELDQETRDYLTSINVAAGEALEAGEVMLPVRLYDIDELKRFERAAEKLKKELRINHQG